MGLILLVGSPIVGPIGCSVQMVTMDQRQVEADQLSKQGQQQFDGSQFEGAFQSWEKALKIYRDIKDRLGEGQSLGSPGNAYYSLGNYPKAIEFQEQRKRRRFSIS